MPTWFKFNPVYFWLLVASIISGVIEFFIPGLIEAGIGVPDFVVQVLVYVLGLVRARYLVTSNAFLSTSTSGREVLKSVDIEPTT